MTQRRSKQRGVALSVAVRAVVQALEARRLCAVHFEFDYSLDAAGFFNAPDRRAALEFAGSSLGSRLGDDLKGYAKSATESYRHSVTNPSTGQLTLVQDRKVGDDTIVVFVGARALSGATLAQADAAGGTILGGSWEFSDLVHRRGQPGSVLTTTLQEPPSDVSPGVGYVSFDVYSPWHFGKTTAGLTGSKIDFVSVAQHELGHVLGIASGLPDDDPFNHLIRDGKFTGPRSVAAYGGAVPVTPVSESHFAEGTRSDGREAAMDPTLSRGTRKLFTTLDYAALADIGWDVLPPAGPTGSIGGTVFHDVDGDAVSGRNEGVLPGVRVYIDRDNDRKFDRSEPNALTAANGSYLFTGLAPGVYRVRQGALGGHHVSTPLSVSHRVTVAAGQHVNGQSFGNSKRVKVAGTLFVDANSNGVRDAGEAPLAGWRVFADWNRNDRFDGREPSVFSAADGSYAFVTTPYRFLLRTGLAPGFERGVTGAAGHAVQAVAGQVVSPRDFGFRRSGAAVRSGVTASAVRPAASPGRSPDAWFARRNVFGSTGTRVFAMAGLISDQTDAQAGLRVAGEVSTMA